MSDDKDNEKENNRDSEDEGSIDEGIVVDLSPSQRESLREAFIQFDKDGSGSIDAKELQLVMMSIGQNPTLAEVQALMATVDSDGNGEIDFNEFCQLMVAKINDEDAPETEEEIREAFKYFDKDYSNTVEPEEILAIFREFEEDQSLDQIKAMIKAVDPDGDGLLRLPAFMKLVMGEDPTETSSPK